MTVNMWQFSLWPCVIIVLTVSEHWHKTICSSGNSSLAHSFHTEQADTQHRAVILIPNLKIIDVFHKLTVSGNTIYVSTLSRLNICISSSIISQNPENI